MLIFIPTFFGEEKKKKKDKSVLQCPFVALTLPLNPFSVASCFQASYSCLTILPLHLLGCSGLEKNKLGQKLAVPTLNVTYAPF